MPFGFPSFPWWWGIIPDLPSWVQSTSFTLTCRVYVVGHASGAWLQFAGDRGALTAVVGGNHWDGRPSRKRQRSAVYVSGGWNTLVFKIDYSKAKGRRSITVYANGKRLISRAVLGGRVKSFAFGAGKQGALYISGIDLSR